MIIHGEGPEVGVRVEVMTGTVIVTEVRVIIVLDAIIAPTAIAARIGVVGAVTEVNPEEEVTTAELVLRVIPIHRHAMKVMEREQQMH